MKIVDLLLVGSLAALGAGCGSNPCQDVIDAVDKASKIQGCADTLKMYTVGVDPNNCTTSTSATKVYEAEAMCFDAVTSCDVAGMISLTRCLSSAQAGG